ncbi:LytR/AlgR family response regulator transcription factor [Arsenicibacter rosenii]|uniref:DNA-binding response regulator n=1 Tax=Arsenicibacter rosenii TaxID=1750698 RepID=A0A1S2VMK2_9BACT|nr:DNA-binding response regulator [Arsenicibacter rosenii]
MANPLRTLIVDDEPLAHMILTDYVSKVPFLTLVGATTSPIDALTRLQRNEVDLILLDIQMPELTGMQFLKLAESGLTSHTCRIILTTAYTDYALEGYEYNVVDYLLKPISFDRFLKAVQKAWQKADPAGDPAASPATPDTLISRTPATTPDFIFVKTEYKLQRVNLPDILYIEGLKDYLSIYTTTERILALQTMKSMDEKLPPEQFMRVHKSYIIALKRIDSIERNRIYIGKAIIPIGDTFRDDFYKRIDQ